jgi:hypothetical protein
VFASVSAVPASLSCTFTGTTQPFVAVFTIVRRLSTASAAKKAEVGVGATNALKVM